MSLEGLDYWMKFIVKTALTKGLMELSKQTA